MKLTDPISPSDNVVGKNLDGEFVLLDLKSSTYFGLNSIGSRVWEMISERPRTVEEVAVAIAEDYSADEGQVREDVLLLAQELHGHGLVVLKTN